MQTDLDKTVWCDASTKHIVLNWEILGEMLTYSTDSTKKYSKLMKVQWEIKQRRTLCIVLKSCLFKMNEWMNERMYLLINCESTKNQSIVNREHEIAIIFAI